MSIKWPTKDPGATQLEATMRVMLMVLYREQATISWVEGDDLNFWATMYNANAQRLRELNAI